MVVRLGRGSIEQDARLLKPYLKEPVSNISSNLGGMFVWGGQYIGANEVVVVQRETTIVSVRAWVDFVFSNDVTAGYQTEINLFGPSTLSQEVSFEDASQVEFSRFRLFVTGTALKLSKISGDDAMRVNGFFFIL